MRNTSDPCYKAGDPSCEKPTVFRIKKHHGGTIAYTYKELKLKQRVE